MKLNVVVSILVAIGGSVAYAGECSEKQMESIRVYDTEVIAACDTDIQGLLATSRSSFACEDPFCARTIDYVVDDIPVCSAAGLSISDMLRAIAQYCKAEGNSTDGSRLGSTSFNKSECSPSEQTTITDLRADPAMTKVCGAYDAVGTISKICESDCSTYVNDKFIPALPECTVYQDVDVKASAKIMLKYCELSSNAAGALTSASIVLLGVLAATALAMR